MIRAPAGSVTPSSSVTSFVARPPKRDGDS